MNSIADYYHNAVKTPGDINEHLPTLLSYATKCRHITEMGVRDVVSTWALLLSYPKRMISYDIVYNRNVETALRLARQEGIDFEFRQRNTLEIEIEPTDFLFIDTLHTYDQLSQELRLHGNKASRYLAFHDTTIFANQDEDGKGRGLMPAIVEFMEANPHWKIDAKYENNYGLLILARHDNSNTNQL